MHTLSRYAATIRHLRASQIWARIWYSVYRPKPALGAAPPLRPAKAEWSAPPPKTVSLMAPDKVRFLNLEADIAPPGIWQDMRQPLLWLYNLHYFDDLSAEAAESRLECHVALVDRWIAENPPGAGIGWQPYPTSLRVVNWIRWQLFQQRLGGAALDSLAAQVRHLARRLEYHILGNHLLTNAKALYFAGAFFGGAEGDRWLYKGRQLLQREIREQVLPDGAHFELSPMYHLIVLEDLLDILNIARTYALELPEGLENALRRMLGWSRVMRHPDGEIPFFNDACFKIAHSPAVLDAYADRLGVTDPDMPSSQRMLQASGYARLSHGDANLYVDAAAVGPDYLPGHAHADTLSFELSLGEERIVVNGGISVYGTGPQRQIQRGTPAHSTVTIDGCNSSDVWAGFRVGRRATVSGQSLSAGVDRTVLSADHDGYAFLNGSPIHRRTLDLDEGALSVTDVIAGNGSHRLESRFLLHPSIRIEACSTDAVELVTQLGRRIRVHGEAGITVEPSTWHPEFGRDEATSCIVMACEPALPYTLRLSFTWNP